MKQFVRSLLLTVALALCAGWSLAQVTTGTPPFSSSTSAGGPEAIDPANLNVHLDIPVVSKAGRGGMNFTYDLSYDSSVWQVLGGTGSAYWYPVYNYGWRGVTETQSGYLSYNLAESICYYYIGKVKYQGYTEYQYSDWVYHDPWGVPHSFFGAQVIAYEGSSEGSCVVGTNQGITNSLAIDGSGFILNAPAEAFPPSTITTTIGKIISPPVVVGAGAASTTDRNGNMISVNSSGVFTDTLGTTALTVAGSGTSTSPTTFTYTPPSNTPVAYTMNYTNYTIATNFGVSGIAEYKSSAAVPLVTSIALPDGTQYSFTYETTPGTCTPYAGTTCTTSRLVSVTLPAGGQITYSYSGGNNGILPDGSAATLTRTTPDGTWKFAQVKNSGAASTTTMTDPQGNVSTIQFQGIYETSSVVNSGSSTVLKTTNTCYNAAASPCTGTAITLPITQRNASNQLAGSKNMTDLHVQKYDDYGNMIEQDDYDYGSGAYGGLLDKTVISYASLGNIKAFQETVTTTNSGGSTVSQTNYNYDQTAVVTTSGTPQHTSVTGSRGNLTSTNQYSTSSAYLTKTMTYFDTGNIDVLTDVDGEPYTYAYGATTSCGNSFPTEISAAYNSLSTSMTWNCNGGVQLTSVDANGQTTTTTYNDQYFWRPNVVIDPLNNDTYLNYVVAGGHEIGAYYDLYFNGTASTANTTWGNDGLGRVVVATRIQAPGASTWDQVAQGYDSNGRLTTTSLPCVTTGSWNCPITATTTQYDALNRVSKITTEDNGITTYTYSNNDVLVTVSPAPTGENTKSRQLEYNSIGQLTSVCEVTSVLPGYGTCGQTNATSGYWTKYSYTPLGQITGVTQNAQSSSTQTRAYVYDLMGRLTAETNPESSLTTYTYDTDATCGTTYNGDLVKKVDAVGDVICFAYDPLQRMSKTSYPSGGYSGNTPSRVFVYDSATVNGAAMANAKGHLAEAYTCSGACTSKITDLGFSYTARGDVANALESTPNSNGYYNVAASYWANGLLDQLSGVPGVPTITYSPDGEGRINTVSASSGQNLVIVNGSTPGTSYNAASQVTQLYLGSGDSDTFGYDNMGRMSQYQFNINGQSETGALSWNPNGTLGQLVITDPFNSGDNQTCNYVHDDLVRIASAGCGSVWSQTFTYDTFSNIVASGSSSFQATYSTTTNRMTQIGSSTPTYDANGNVTNDFLNTYSWDANARPIVIDGITVTYDALGRIAEEDKSGTYTQFVYSPTGQEFALMNGQTLSKAYVPLPAGEVAAYNSSGLYNYHHMDWLGNFRLSSSTTRTVLYDAAYAPFGVAYAQTGTGIAAFTGMTSDTAASVYDFPAREYGTQGRWPSPDPAGMAAVDPTNPQSWNRYAYVGNQPLVSIDPTGLKRVAPPPTFLGGLYQDCIWNGGCSGLSQGPPYAGFDIGALGGLAPGTYIDGVQQTIFNSVGGLGNNAITTGYQATITNSDGSSSTVTLAAPFGGTIYSSDAIAFEDFMTEPTHTGTASAIIFNWVGASCSGAAVCSGQFASKAWFPATKPQGTTSVKPPTKLSAPPVPSISGGLPLLPPSSLGSGLASIGIPLPVPPYIW